MHAHDEHLLVVRPVEDANLAAGRKLPGVTPEIVVIELLRRGDLEAVNADALWIDSAHHVTDRSVLAAGVERLQDHEHAVGVLRREAGLILGQQLDALLQKRDSVLLLANPCLESRIEILRESHLRARLDPERLDEFRNPLGMQVRHRRPPRFGRPRPLQASGPRYERPCRSGQTVAGRLRASWPTMSQDLTRHVTRTG